MKDPIERQNAIDAVSRGCQEFRGVFAECEKNLNELPPAQPESAQWVQMLINPNLYKCSNCQVAWNKRLVFDNDGYSENIFMKYCPCCGRKMQTEVDYE